MQERDMILLIELVDELLRLDEAIKNLGGLGYSEKFPKLDNVYTVLMANSVYADCKTEEEEQKFYEIVDGGGESAKRRVEILLLT